MLVFLLSCILLSVSTAEPLLQEIDPPYCAMRYRRLCQGKGRHVACQFPVHGPGESCVNYTHIKFTKELRHFVTHYINRRRQRLAAGNERVRGGVHLPRPEVMMQVEWDRELALLAQRLADQCSFVHDDCRATVRFPYAGQTVGEVKWRRTSESDNQNVARAIRRVLDAWWGERRRVTAKQLTQPFRLTNKGNVWGHFSQLAVWTLRAVGCGAVRHGNKYPRILLVCDFSHTNMLGQRTIVPGVLQPCPIHTARKIRSPYPTLCAPVRNQDSEQSNSRNRHPMDYEHENDDAVPEYHEYDEMDEAASFNATHRDPSEDSIAFPERKKPNTRKRIKAKTEKPNEHVDDDGNEIEAKSQENEQYQKDKIYEKELMHDDDDDDDAHEEESEPKVIDKTNINMIHKKTTNKYKTGDDDEEKTIGTETEDEKDSRHEIEIIYQLKEGSAKDNPSDISSKYDDEAQRKDQNKIQDNAKEERVQYSEESSESIQQVTGKCAGNTRSFKVKKIRDRDKGRERPSEVKRPSYMEEPIKESISSSQREETQVERVRPLSTEREEQTETERGFEQEHFPEDPVPERESESLLEREQIIAKGPPERERILDVHEHPERGRMPAKHPGRERLDGPGLPERESYHREPEREEYPERIPERNKQIGTEEPPGRERTYTVKATHKPYRMKDITDTTEIQSPNYRYTTETPRYKDSTERNRHMINIDGLQRQQKKFFNPQNIRKEAARQQEFQARQSNLNQFGKAPQHNERGMFHAAMTPRCRHPHQNYPSDKYQMNDFNVFETSPRDLLDNLKAIGHGGGLGTVRTQFYEPVGIRHRWRPTKDRPERPGAKALTTIPYMYMTTRPPAPKKNAMTLRTITMDKDDVEQLFKDTGFNPGWKLYRKMLS